MADRDASAEEEAPARAPPAAAADAERSKIPPAASTSGPRSNDGATRYDPVACSPAVVAG